MSFRVPDMELQLRNPPTLAPGYSARPPLLRGHHRHAVIARAQPLRGRREIQRRAAFIGAAAGDHQSVGTGHDFTLAKRWVVLDLNRRETDLVLAVACASRDQ